jgi:hypothetical protein
MSTVKTLLNFDTINATQLYTEFTDYTTYPTPYKCSFNLQRPFKKIKSIALKSIELPITFSNVRKTNWSSFMVLNFTYGSWTNQHFEPYLTLTGDLNFTDVSDLLTHLNDNIQMQIASSGYTGFQLSIAYDSYAQRVYFTTNATAITITSTVLGVTMLGFIAGSQTISGGVITAPMAPNLNYDLYVNMELSNVPAVEPCNVNGFNGSFKLALPVVFEQILFWTENMNYRQAIRVDNDALVLNSIFVHFTDRFGKLINQNNGFYSFTLEIEEEV